VCCGCRSGLRTGAYAHHFPDQNKVVVCCGCRSGLRTGAYTHHFPDQNEVGGGGHDGGMTALVGVRLRARAGAWGALGFELVGGRLALANGTIVCDDGATGLAALVVDQVAGDADGLPVELGAVMSGPPPITRDELDHVVVMTDSLERTSAAIESALDLECRRIRETGQVRQAFHRFDDPADGRSRGCILEIVENPQVTAAQFWGLVVTVDDLDRLFEWNQDLISPPKPAVQPGRRIATVRRDAELGTAVAFMSR
jgi:hypothetical protein